MGLFDFFKKSEAEIPPDVGQEEKVEAVDDSDGGVYEDEPEEQPEEEQEEAPRRRVVDKSAKQSRSEKKGGGARRRVEEVDSEKFEMQDFEIKKVSARMESLDAFIKGLNERFSNMNQQIGELRAMGINHEKAMGKVYADSSRAIDIVKEVKPERLRIDVQKAEMKVAELSEKLESNKQFMETIMNELKDLRLKMGTFVGTEALLRLNEDVKKDLIGTQQVASKAKAHADKAEQIFIEINRSFADTQKALGNLANLESNYSGLRKDFEKVRLDFSSVAMKYDLADLKKYVEGKLSVVDGAVAYFDKAKNENERVARVMETTLAIAQQNKRDIADIAMTIGDDNIKRVADYDNQLNSILRILDTLAGQISALKKKAGIKEPKIKVSAKPKAEEPLKEEKVNLENIEVHPSVSEKLVVPRPEVSEQMQKIVDSAKKGTGNLKKKKAAKVKKEKIVIKDEGKKKIAEVKKKVIVKGKKN